MAMRDTNPITSPITPDGLVGFCDRGQLWIGEVEWGSGDLIFRCRGRQDVREMTCAICRRGWGLDAESFGDQSRWDLINETVHLTCLIRHLGLVERDCFRSALIGARIPNIGLKPIANGLYVAGYDPRRDPWCLKPWYWTRVLTSRDEAPPGRDVQTRVEAMQALGHNPSIISITLGWRKSVASIEVAGEGYQQLHWWEDAEREFKDENVTKHFNAKSVGLHAGGFAVVTDYLTRLARVADLQWKDP
jgi:hypothetical protein